MTNGELIEKLSKLPKDQEAIVQVRVHTQAYSVARVSPFEVDYSGIFITLPSNMHTVSRKI